MPKERGNVHLWDFPAQDFPMWKKLCADEDDFNTYAEYQAALRKLERLLGKESVTRLKIPVTKFMILLAQRGLENTSANRAELLRVLGAEGYLSGEKGDKPER